MILDEWKRLCTNTKTNFREVAIKGFWDMYDPEGYSLWFCNYKYKDENTISFVTLNKVGGFLQRMDLARKYAFGKKDASNRLRCSIQGQGTLVIPRAGHSSICH